MDRRRFVVQSAVAAGLVWSTPTVQAVRLVGGVGSPPPSSQTTATTSPTGSASTTTSTSTSTTTSPQPDVLITGGGWVDDHKRFGLNARTNANGPSGQLQYSYGPGPPTKVHSIDITSVQVDGDRSTVTGTATVDGTSGFTFRVDVVDGDRDRFAIVVFATDGSIFHQLGNPGSPLELRGGSIQIH